jgi:hypothetical protein
MRRLALLGLVIVAVASACGGGGGGGRLSAEEYASKLGAICADYNNFQASVSPPTSTAEIPAWTEKVLPHFRDAVSRAKKLKPPEDEQAQVNEFLSIADQEGDVLEEVRDAAKAGDEGKFQQLNTRGKALDARSDNIARRLGANDCVTE